MCRPPANVLLQVVPKTSAILRLGGEREEVIYHLGSDHITVCKFGREDDSLYRCVKGALVSMTKEGARAKEAARAKGVAMAKEAVSSLPFSCT